MLNLARKSAYELKLLGLATTSLSTRLLSTANMTHHHQPQTPLVRQKLELVVPTRSYASEASTSDQQQQQQQQSAANDSSVDEKEINKFRLLANAWWTENGEFEALHRMNRLRVPIIRDAMLSYLQTLPDDDERSARTPTSTNVVSGITGEPLAGLNILDVGCGGGILSEALARLGAQVTGVDACKENIAAAQMRIRAEFERSRETAAHCRRLRYLHCTVEELAVVDENAGYFDAVVMSEVVEHVANVAGFVANAAKLLKNHGYMFATTINRTRLSYLLAIVAAERVLGLVPRGTHEWSKFVRPDELKGHMVDNEVSVKFEMGMFYNPVTKNWSWVEDKSVNYAMYGQKLKTSI